jgi:hypothetical protein
MKMNLKTKEMTKYKIGVEKNRIILFVSVFIIGLLLTLHTQPLLLFLTIFLTIVIGVISLSIKPEFIFLEDKFAVKSNMFKLNKNLELFEYNKIAGMEYHNNRGRGADSITISYYDNMSKESYTYSTSLTKEVENKIEFLKTKGINIIVD